MTWTPSVGLRVINMADYLDTDAPATAVMPAKESGDVLDYVFDGTELLADDGDTFAGWSSSVSGPDVALVVVSELHEQMLFGVMLAGGTPGATYAVTASVTTAAGRSVSVTASLTIGAA
jgi:hypothetical protein